MESSINNTDIDLSKDKILDQQSPVSTAQTVTETTVDQTTLRLWEQKWAKNKKDLKEVEDQTRRALANFRINYANTHKLLDSEGGSIQISAAWSVSALKHTADKQMELVETERNRLKKYAEDTFGYKNLGTSPEKTDERVSYLEGIPTDKRSKNQVVDLSKKANRSRSNSPNERTTPKKDKNRSKSAQKKINKNQKTLILGSRNSKDTDATNLSKNFESFGGEEGLDKVEAQADKRVTKHLEDKKNGSIESVSHENLQQINKESVASTKTAEEKIPVNDLQIQQKTQEQVDEENLQEELRLQQQLISQQAHKNMQNILINSKPAQITSVFGIKQKAGVKRTSGAMLQNKFGQKVEKAEKAKKNQKQIESQRVVDTTITEKDSQSSNFVPDSDERISEYSNDGKVETMRTRLNNSTALSGQKKNQKNQKVYQKKQNQNFDQKNQRNQNQYQNFNQVSAKTQAQKIHPIQDELKDQIRKKMQDQEARIYFKDSLNNWVKEAKKDQQTYDLYRDFEKGKQSIRNAEESKEAKEISLNLLKNKKLEKIIQEDKKNYQVWYDQFFKEKKFTYMFVYKDDTDESPLVLEIIDLNCFIKLEFYEIIKLEYFINTYPEIFDNKHLYKTKVDAQIAGEAAYKNLQKVDSSLKKFQELDFKDYFFYRYPQYAKRINDARFQLPVQEFDLNTQEIAQRNSMQSYEDIINQMPDRDLMLQKVKDANSYCADFTIFNKKVINVIDSAGNPRIALYKTSQGIAQQTKRFYGKYIIHVSIEDQFQKDIGLPTLNVPDNNHYLLKNQTLKITLAELENLCLGWDKLRYSLKVSNFCLEKVLNLVLTVGLQAMTSKTSIIDKLSESMIQNQIYKNDDIPHKFDSKALKTHIKKQIQVKKISSYKQVCTQIKDDKAEIGSNKKELLPQIQEMIKHFIYKMYFRALMIVSEYRKIQLEDQSALINIDLLEKQATEDQDKFNEKYVNYLMDFWGQFSEEFISCGSLIKNSLAYIISEVERIQMIQIYSDEFIENNDTGVRIIEDFANQSFASAEFWASPFQLKALYKCEIEDLMQAGNDMDQIVQHPWRLNIEGKALIEQYELDKIKLTRELDIADLELQKLEKKLEDFSISVKFQTVNDIQKELRSMIHKFRRYYNYGDTHIAEYVNQNISTDENFQSVEEHLSNSKIKNQLINGSIYMIPIQGVVYGKYDRRAEASDSTQLVDYKQVKIVHQMLFAKLNTLKRITYLIKKFSLDLLDQQYEENAIQIHTLIIAYTLYEISFAESNESDLNQKQFDTFIANLVFSLNVENKSKVFAYAIEEVKIIIDELDTLEVGTLDYYHPSMVKNMQFLHNNQKSIAEDLEKNIQATQKYMYDGFSTSQLMKNTSDSDAIRLEQEQYAKKAFIFTQLKQNDTMPLGSYNSEVVAASKKIDWKQTKISTYTNVAKFVAVHELKLKLEALPKSEMYTFRYLIRTYVQNQLSREAMDLATVASYHDSANNDQPIEMQSILTEKIKLHVRDNEFLEQSRESKFRKWQFEIYCSIMVLNQYGMDGLKVYLNDIGVCTSNITNECFDTNCPSMHEVRPYIKCIVREHLKKVLPNNFSDAKDQYYLQSMRREDVNVNTYLGGEKTLKQISQQIEKKRMLKRSMDVMTGQTPIWMLNFQDQEEIYGYRSEEIDLDFKRSIFNQSKLTSGDEMLRKMRTIILSHYENRDTLYRSPNNSYIKIKRKTQAGVEIRTNLDQLQFANEMEYLLKFNMTYFMGSTLFGLGLYHEINDYVIDVDLRYSENFKAYSHRKTREFLVQTLLISMHERYKTLVKHIRAMIGYGSTIHNETINFLSNDYMLIHPHIMNFFTSSFADTLQRLYRNLGIIDPTQQAPNYTINVPEELDLKTINHFIVSINSMLGRTTHPTVFLNTINDWSLNLLLALQFRTITLVNMIGENDRKYIPERIRKAITQKMPPFETVAINNSQFTKGKIFWEYTLDKQFPLHLTNVAKVIYDEKEKKYQIDPNNNLGKLSSNAEGIDLIKDMSNLDTNSKEMIVAIQLNLDKSFKMIFDNYIRPCQQESSKQLSSILKKQWLYDDTHFKNEKNEDELLWSANEKVNDYRGRIFAIKQGYDPKQKVSHTLAPQRNSSVFYDSQTLGDPPQLIDQFRVEELSAPYQLLAGLQQIKHINGAIHGGKSEKLNISKDPIRNSIKCAFKQDPQIVKKIDSVGVILSNNCMTRYEMRTLDNLKKIKDPYEQIRQTKLMSQTAERMVYKLVKVIKTLSLEKILEENELDKSSSESGTSISIQQLQEITLDMGYLIKTYADQKLEVNQILDHASNFLSQQLAKHKIDLTNAQFEEIQKQTELILHKRLKNVQGYVKSYYHNQNTGETLILNVSKIMKRMRYGLAYANKIDALSKQGIDHAQIKIIKHRQTKEVRVIQKNEDLPDGFRIIIQELSEDIEGPLSIMSEHLWVSEEIP